MTLPGDFLIRPYEVGVSGFEPLTFHAASPGKARAAAWRAYTACHECSFGAFLSLSSVRRAFKPRAGFGERIFVSGRLAYRVPPDMDVPKRNVRFVYPGATVILEAHPSDVTVPA